MAALTSPEGLVIVEKCCARVGFLGNPSDGFHGKTLSFLIDNFAATVTISPSPGPLTIVEEAVFDDLLHVHRHSSVLVSLSPWRCASQIAPNHLSACRATQAAFV